MSDQIAWFVCRTKTVADDVCLPLRRTAPESEIVKQGSARARRVFCREHGLHPCARVEVEFMGVVDVEEFWRVELRLADDVRELGEVRP